MSTDTKRADGVRIPRPDATKPGTLLIAAGYQAFRWLSVATDKDLRDNATFLYDATKATGRHPSRRLSRAKWRRASFRWSVVGLPVSMEVAGLVAWPTAQVADLLDATAPAWSTLPWHTGAMSVLGASALTWAGVGTAHGVRLLRRAGARRMEKRVAQAIARLLGPDADLDNAVRISPDFTADPWVEVSLPEKWVMSEPAKARLVHQVGQRVDFRSPQGEWMTAGARPKVTIRPLPAPPDRLVWSEVSGRVAELDVHHVLIGVGERGPVVVSLDTDSPHTVTSGATGKGKSVFIKMMLTQRLAHGTGVILIDHKNSVAYDYIRTLPSDMARAYVQPDVINTVLCLLELELEWRIAAREADRSLEFRRLDIVLEEGNSFPGRMEGWWRKTGGRGEVPGLLARDQIILMGREYGMHVHLAAQQADATVFAEKNGSSQRVNFGLRMLAGYEKGTWSMLAYGHPWRPEPDGPIGIWTLVSTRGAEAIRVPWITDEEARRWALRGSGEHLLPLTSGVSLPLTGESLSPSETTLDLLQRPAGLVTLAEHAQQTGDVLGNLRAWVSRNGILPEVSRPGSAGDLFRRDALSSRVPSPS